MGILNKFKVLAQGVFHNVAGVSFVWFTTMLFYFTHLNTRIIKRSETQVCAH